MSRLQLARLLELQPAAGGGEPTRKSGGREALVQFNPESLKVSYANQVVEPPKNAKSQSQGTVSRQYVGAGSTKLTLQLWFDVTAPWPDGMDPVDDVRRLTSKVSAFMRAEAADKEGKAFLPPLTRFAWGSFSFDGLVDSLEETLEFFSAAGVPLRASMSLAMSQQKIVIPSFDGAGAPGAPRTPGATPLAAAPRGASLQNLAAASGRRDQWQGIAAANGIENPRALLPGQLIDLSVSASVSGSLSASASASVSRAAAGSLRAGGALSLNGGGRR